MGKTCPYKAAKTGSKTDRGGSSYIAEIARDAGRNTNFRTAYWTGENLQMTLMCIPVGGCIGEEIHPSTDQLIRVEQGRALVRLGSKEGEFEHEQCIGAGGAVFVKGGTWHNVINAGNMPLKLSSIYAPPQHPYGTIHVTKAEAEH